MEQEYTGFNEFAQTQINIKEDTDGTVYVFDDDTGSLLGTGSTVVEALEGVEL